MNLQPLTEITSPMKSFNYAYAVAELIVWCPDR
jgi:hypothetical protein